MKAKLKNCIRLKNIIRIILIVIPVSFLGATMLSCKGIGIIRGSGNVISEDRDVSGFSMVSISGSGNLYIEQGDKEGITIVAEDNVLPFIVSKVSGDTLKIYKIGPSKWMTKGIEYHLKVKDLENISGSGSGNIICSALNTEKLIIETSGSRKVSIDNLRANVIGTNSSGSGSINLSGTIYNQDIKISGSVKYSAEELSSNNCSIDASGSSEIVVNVSDDLSINISGRTKITYIGSPAITQKTSGSATISSK